jgi:hypothetical protein
MILRSSLLLLGLLVSFGARAQQESLATTIKSPAPVKSAWSSELSYDFMTDFADERPSRSYTHSVRGEVEYEFYPGWSVLAGLRGSADTADNRIQKEQQTSHVDTFSPMADVGVGYGGKFGNEHIYSVGAKAFFPMSEDARAEGYKAIVTETALLGLSIFPKRLKLGQLVSATQIANVYYYGTRGAINHDSSYGYKASLSLVLGAGFSTVVAYGVKTSHYLDGYWGYSYGSEVALTKKWTSLAAALAYVNGGYTDDGRVRMWFVDEYRRIVAASLSYAY